MSMVPRLAAFRPPDLPFILWCNICSCLHSIAEPTSRKFVVFRLSELACMTNIIVHDFRFFLLNLQSKYFAVNLNKISNFGRLVRYEMTFKL